MTTDDLWQRNFTDHLDVAQATRFSIPYGRSFFARRLAGVGGLSAAFGGSAGQAIRAVNWRLNARASKPIILIECLCVWSFRGMKVSRG